VHATTKAAAIRFVAFMIGVPQQETHFRRCDAYDKGLEENKSGLHTCALRRLAGSYDP
jgi:hypothetical protein